MNIPSHESYHLMGGHRAQTNKQTRIHPIVRNATIKINHGGNTHTDDFGSWVLPCEYTLILAYIVGGWWKRDLGFGIKNRQSVHSYLVWTFR